MKELILSKNGALKISSGNSELYRQDFEDVPKRVVSGEWCYFVDSKKNVKHIGYVNVLANEKSPIGFVVEKCEFSTDPWDIIKNNIEKAFLYRSMFSTIGTNGRMFYGDSDGLPGLIVDCFENKAVIQINTMGIDSYRREIKKLIEEKTNKKAYLLDNIEYRKREGLPIHDDVEICHDGASVVENGFKFKIASEVEQKLGHYYDHRNNRQKIKELIENMRIEKNSGVDLFCYSGAWGINGLAAGIKKMDFVDQGNFSETVTRNVELNDFDGSRAEFFRENVFDFLNKKIEEKITYNIVLSDPPAFAKSSAMKKSALEGYKKLHDKIFQVIEKNGLISISSCTKYVSYEELDQTVQEAAKKNKRKIKLIDHGQQGLDHPIRSITDKAHYIKYLAYWVD